MTARLASLVALLAVVITVGAGSARHAVAMHHGGKIIVVGANKSNNWSGYNQGALEQGGKTFHSVSGSWTVPTAKAHKARPERVRRTTRERFSTIIMLIKGNRFEAHCRNWNPGGKPFFYARANSAFRPRRKQRLATGAGPRNTSFA